MKKYDDFIFEGIFSFNKKKENSVEIDSLKDHDFIIDQIIKYLNNHKDTVVNHYDKDDEAYDLFDGLQTTIMGRNIRVERVKYARKNGNFWYSKIYGDEKIKGRCYHAFLDGYVMDVSMKKAEELYSALNKFRFGKSTFEEEIEDENQFEEGFE